MKYLSIALFVVLACFGQSFGQVNQKLQKKRFVTIAEKLQKAARLEKEAVGKPLPANPVFAQRSGAPVHSTTAVTFSDLGQSNNPFTILGAGRNVLSVQPSLNSVAFFRRGGPTDPGGITGSTGNKVFYDVNTQGGADGSWQISQGPVFKDDNYVNDPTHTSQGGSNNFGARYPQGALFNPSGNVNASNSVAMTISRVLDGSNDAWGGLGTGWKKLASNGVQAQNLETSTDPLHFRTESMEVTANAVFATEPEEDLSSGGVVFTNRIAVYKYTYSSASNNFTKTTVFLPFTNQGGDYSTSISSTAIAFAPNGQTGYVVVTAANNDFDSTATYIPYISKTTNGGQSWSSLLPIRINKEKNDGPSTGLDSFRDKMLSNLVYFDADGNLNTATYADAATKSVHYVDYLVNDIDLVVDNNNYAHLFASIAVSGFGDTLNATFPGGVTYYPGYGSWNMHLFLNDPLGIVKGELINQNMGLNGCWGDCAGSDNFTDANRPQVARSEDGSVLAFAWYDTDSASHPQLTTDNNSNPDLWLQRVRVAGAGQFFYGPRSRNMTKGSDNDGLAALGNVAPRLLNKPTGGYSLASTIALFADFDPATGTAVMPTQHLYVGNVNIPVAVDSFPVQVIGDMLNGPNSTLATISTNNVSSIQANSAVCGGNVSDIGTSSVTARGVCWSTSPSPTVALSTKTVNGSGLGTFNSNLTGLLQGTTYYVRAYATNASGTAYGNEIPFSTLTPASLATLSTNAISAITQTSATGGGNVSSDGGAAVTARGVCWSTTQNPTTALSTKTVNGTGTGTFTSSLAGLSAGTTYYVRAYATNSVGTSYGNQVQFTTQAATALATLSTNAISNVGQTTATGGGNISADGGAAVFARGVCWSTSQNPSIDLTTKTVDGSGTGGFSSSITGLNPNTTYYVRAYAINSVGAAYGSQVQFTTQAATSLATLNTIVITNIGQTTATGGGAIITDGGAGVTARGICWSTTPTPTTALPTKTVNGSGTGVYSSSLTGLNPGTQYYVRAYATNSVGTAYGNEVTFTTQPSQPQTVTITYKVDITNYLAGGASLGANGIRIGGNFGDRGASSAGGAMVNWSPADANSALTSLGNNIWSIQVTYPSSSIGSVQSYKFVNNDWGTNEGTDPANTIASGGCGVDDGAGNINRTQIIPATSTEVCFVWDACTPCSFTPQAPVVSTANPATNISSNSATVGGSASGNGISARGVCYATTQNPSLSNFVVNAGTGAGDFSADMSFLLPSTQYFARAYATNSAGTTYGNEISFTTTASAQLPTLSTTTAGNIGQNTASSGGAVISDGGAAVTLRGVCWSTNQNPTADLASKTIDGSGSGVFSSSLSGLNPATTYFVRAYATNSVGTAYGNEISFTTLANNVIPTLGTLDVTAVTETSASCGGLVISDGGAPVTVRGVCWSTSQNPTADLATKTIDGNGTGTFSSSITGLSAGITYFVRAYATNSVGTAYGNEVSFTSTPTAVNGQEKRSLVFPVPNPSSTKVRFGGLQGSGELQITSVLGTEVIRMPVQADQSIDVSQLPRSAYFFTIKTPEGLFKGKLILQ